VKRSRCIYETRAEILIVGIRPELRYMLRVASSVYIRVWGADTLPRFVKCLSAADIRLVIIDRWDAPTLAKRAVNNLRRFPRPVASILIAREEHQRREPVCDITLGEGLTFYDRLLRAVKVATFRKRGPVQRYPELCRIKAGTLIPRPTRSG
jgi:hypothetical protein